MARGRHALTAVIPAGGLPCRLRSASDPLIRLIFGVLCFADSYNVVSYAV